MVDGVVQVDADGVGKKVDTSELTRPDFTVVERERVVIGDPSSATGAQRLAAVIDGELQVGDKAIVDALMKVIMELRELRLQLLDALH